MNDELAAKLDTWIPGDPRQPPAILRDAGYVQYDRGRLTWVYTSEGAREQRARLEERYPGLRALALP